MEGLGNHDDLWWRFLQPVELLTLGHKVHYLWGQNPGFGGSRQTDSTWVPAKGLEFNEKEGGNGPGKQEDQGQNE